MSIASLGNSVKKKAKHHPILLRCVGFFLAVAFALGLMHEAEIGGEISIVLVKRFKHQAAALIDVGKRLKHELTTWEPHAEHAAPANEHGHTDKKTKEGKGPAQTSLPQKPDG